MKKLISIMCAVLLVPVAAMVNAADDTDPAKRLLRELLGIEDKQPVTPPPPVEHTMYTIIGGSSFGKIELDQTTKEIVFTAPHRGTMYVRLYRDEAWERMGFSIVHTTKRHPYQSGYTYKLLLTKKEQFTIVYFREDEGRVSVKNLL